VAQALALARPRCDASYERTNILCVLGEESEAGYL
jgi:hypothetical protein